MGTAKSKGERAMAESPAASGRTHAGRALWRNRDYNLLWTGRMVSSAGAQASTLAFPLLLRAWPYVVFRLPAGALVDR